MIHADLLKMLRCPEDRSVLVEADRATIDRLNAAIEAGTLRNRGGEKVTQRFDGGLIRGDGRYLYPIIDGIPVMLVDEGVPLA